MTGLAGEQPQSQDVFESNLEICYEVLLYLSSRLARLQPGETFEFITSDLSADEKISEWCDQRGYNLLKSEVLPDGRHRFLIKKDVV
jgi:TusA-related sulfurtransferase